MLRTWGSMVAAVALVVSASSAAFAADTAQKTQQGALAAGAPAGVHKAEWVWTGNTWIWVVGAGAVIGGVALAASGNSNGTPATTTTTTAVP